MDSITKNLGGGWIGVWNKNPVNDGVKIIEFAKRATKVEIRPLNESELAKTMLGVKNKLKREV